MAVLDVEAGGAAGGRQELELSWTDVTYDVLTDKKEPLRLLHGVSGRCAPGEMVAVMGPSGCGKSTLLNCLAMRWNTGLGGSIMVNGSPRPTHFKRLCGYSTQDNPFLRVFSVKETLTFFARLRLPNGTPAAEVARRVDEVMAELDLTSAADVIIGSPEEGGISGGQARRLGIAAELICVPPILLLDEPTSGLDAGTAYSLCQIMAKYATEKRISLIMTIHQPRSAVLQSMTRLLLLALGKTVYSGPTWTGKGSDEGDALLKYFESSIGTACPRFENPADWILDLLHDNEENRKEDSVVEKLHQAYIAQAGDRDRADKAAVAAAPAPPTQDVATYTVPFFARLGVLFRRSLTYKLREPTAVMTQSVNSVFMPVVISLIFLRMGLSQIEIQDRFSAISFMILMQAFLGFDQILVFPNERAVFHRDHESGLYCVLSSFLSRLASEAPFIWFFGFTAATVSYWMMGFQEDAEKFFIFAAIMICVTDVGMALLNLVGSVSRTVEQANILVTVILLVFMLFNGFFANTQNVGPWFSWIRYINFIFYGTRAATINEFGGLEFECTEEEAETMGCTLTGEQFLTRLGFKKNTILLDCIIMIVMAFVFRCGTYVALKTLYWKKH